MNVGMPVGTAGLDEKDARRRIFAQAICQHAASRAGTDDDVIVARHLTPRHLTRYVAATRRILIARITDQRLLFAAKQNQQDRDYADDGPGRQIE